MKARECVTYNADVEAVRQAAMIIAVTIKAQDGSQGPRQQAAVAALQALADGARDLLLEATGNENHCISADPNNRTEAEIGREAGP